MLPTSNQSTHYERIFHMQNGNIKQQELQSQTHLEFKNFRQNLNNLPVELSEAKRFFPVVLTPDGKKLPRIKEWQNPDNQKFAAQIEGLVGFDTCGHSIEEDYLFLDFDHVLDNNGNFVNDNAYRWYNFCASMESFCEKSISGHGIHILAKPTQNKFSPISAGSRGTLHFGNEAKLEIFYKPKARYCLVTGDLFNCEPNTPIVYGEIADDIFQTLLNEISKKNPVLATKSKGRDFNCADDADYTEFCALRMLDDIDPIVLEDSDWLAVISACKNIGVSYAAVDNFNRRDPDRYNEKENETRWQSLDDSSFNIRTLHGIAKRFGYFEKDSRREWYKLHPELKPSTSKNTDDKTKHELDEAIIFLDNFSADNLSAKDIYHPNTIHFVALAQTYGFITQYENFFSTIKIAKNVAKNRITESNNKLTANPSETELTALNALASLSIDTLRKTINNEVHDLKQQQKAFAKRQEKIRAQEQAKEKAAKRDIEIKENAQQLAKLLNEYENKPTEELAKKIQTLILNSCDTLIDKYTGKIKCVKATADNADLIFSFDPVISGIIGYDEFQQADVFIKQAPWYTADCIGNEWKDKDDAEIRAYLRRTYTEFAGKNLIDDWLTSFSNKNAFHAVKNYFKKLPKWDGIPRAETLFIKFLRVDDTPYAREVTMNWLIAAVARIFHPGCRYQTALVLHGAQGIGKSYIIERLGGKWYSAIIDNVDDPHAIDALKIVWIGEFKEMAAMRKAELNAIKSFIERSEDNRRAAYERRSSKILRHCVFVITVNDDQFLSDMTGNRRYMILHCNSAPLNYVEGLTDEYIQQVWAEVYYKFNEMFKDGFDEAKLALSHSVQIQAEEIAQNYMRDDGMTGEINAFLYTKIPPLIIWNLLTKEERRQFIVSGFVKLLDGERDLYTRRRAKGGRNVQHDIDLLYNVFHNNNFIRRNTIKRGDCTLDEWFIYGSEYRQHICAAEIFNECFGNDNRKKIFRIHEILNNLEGWVQGQRIAHDPVYGNQPKVFYRVT